MKAVFKVHLTDVRGTWPLCPNPSVCWTCLRVHQQTAPVLSPGQCLMEDERFKSLR